MGEFNLPPSGATLSTKKNNANLLAQLPLADDQDFEDASRGFMAPLPDGVSSGTRPASRYGI